MDGNDISAVLESGAASPHDQLLLFNNEDLFAIRTQRWKYVKYTYFRDHIESFDIRGYKELFDLDIDPAENYSVASMHPDVVAEMERRMAEANRTFGPMKGMNRPREKQPARD